MSKENPEKAKAREKCQEFDTKYEGHYSIRLALESFQKSTDFVKIINDPILEGFFAKNQKRGASVFEVGLNHATRQMPVALMTVANIRKLICLVDLTYDAIETNPGSKYDWKSAKGIQTDFQSGPFFGKKFKDQKELDAAFAGQLESIKADSKIKKINDLKNTDDLVAYYETSGKFGWKAEEKKKLDKDADSKSKNSRIHGNKDKTRHNFSKAEKENIKKYIEEKGCTVKENGPNSIIAIGKDGKEECTVTPNEVVVTGTDYKLAIHLALINFPGQTLIFDYVPAAEKPKFEKAFKEAMNEFKEAHPDMKDDIKYVFEIEVSKKSDKSSNRVTDLEKKYPEVVHDTRKCSLTGGNGKEWYYSDEVKDIISATEYAAGQKWHSQFLTYGNSELPEEDIKENKKFYRLLQPDTTVNCKEWVKKELTQFLQIWKTTHSAIEVGTFVFPTLIGGNHFATYACNTNGEILAINSLGGSYRGWDDAAVRGIQEALRDYKIQAKLPIKITSDQSGDF